jgi:hypothetical protein
MKNSFYTFSFLITILSCGPSEQKDSAVPETEAVVVADYALAIDSAVTYIHNFEKQWKNFTNKQPNDSIPLPLKAFSVRAEDLMEALGLPESEAKKAKYHHARFYLAMDNNNRFRLLITPVDDNNKDIILNGPYVPTGSMVGTQASESGSYVLDFNQPCPKTCDETSVLNN